MQETFNTIMELVKNKPSAEVFKIQSLDGKKIMTTSFDGKECDQNSVFKKEGFIVLFSNY